MKIRLLSDLHLEFEEFSRDGTPRYPNEYFNVPELPDDKDTVLILAGDIGVIRSRLSIEPFLEEIVPRFKQVLYVLGNHEYYHGSLVRGYNKLYEMVRDTGVILLEKEKVKIDDVNFLGTTLWSNYNNNNPRSMAQAESSMTDYRIIRTGYSNNPYKRKARTMDFITCFLNAEAWLNSELYNIRIRDGEKCVVITHHAPSFRSVAHEFIHANNLNGAYASDLEDMITNHGPDLWVHGHMHNSVDYQICGTRIVTNPRGYTPNDLNKDFDPCLLVEI